MAGLGRAPPPRKTRRLAVALEAAGDQGRQSLRLPCMRRLLHTVAARLGAWAAATLAVMTWPFSRLGGKQEPLEG
jgi:hypothetical protein